MAKLSCRTKPHFPILLGERDKSSSHVIKKVFSHSSLPTLFSLWNYIRPLFIETFKLICHLVLQFVDNSSLKYSIILLYQKRYCNSFTYAPTLHLITQEFNFVSDIAAQQGPIQIRVWWYWRMMIPTLSLLHLLPSGQKKKKFKEEVKQPKKETKKELVSPSQNDWWVLEKGQCIYFWCEFEHNFFLFI